jgi:lysine 6-dehydrogenase
VAVQADATDVLALKRLFGQYDVVVNSTWYQFNLPVMEAAIQSGVDYLDLGGLYHTTIRQLELDGRAKDAGITCILGMGSSPGTMNVLAAHGASKMTKISKVNLRSGSVVVSKPSDVFQSPYSLRTVIDEFTLPPVILRDGRLKEIPALSGKERFTLPEPINEMEGYYTLHSELATLPGTLGKGVRDMDFIVAYPPEFTRTMVSLVKMGLTSLSPVRVKGLEVKPYDLLVAAVDSLPKTEPELDIDVQRVELYGEIDGRSVTLRYDAVTAPSDRWKIGGGTVDTGVPPSIAAQWLAKGMIKARGVVPPESCIDPLPYFSELSRRGIRVYERSEETRPLF